MVRANRMVVRMLLVGVWAISLLFLAYPARVQAQGGGTHTVASGETLSQIARQYGTDVATLLELNDLANANVVYVGQQLVVAGRSGGSRSEPARWAEASEEASGDEELGYGEIRWADGTTTPASRASTRPGVGWEPEGNERGPSRPGVGWEPQESTSYAGASEEDSRDSYGEIEEDAWQPRSAERNPNRARSDWDVDASGDSYPAGVGWEPAPSVAGSRGGDEAELSGEKWIDIDISDQLLTAYQGDSAVRYFTISSGSSRYPTVTGSFRTYARTELQDMSGGSQAAGDYYFQPDVPWVQYFFESYAIHGAYWHNQFGSPIGHGCINMRVEESRWLYEWTGVTGIRVEVHQ